MQEMLVWYQGPEDPLEKEMASHFGILAWEIPWTEEPGGLHSMGSQKVRHDWATNTHTDMHTYMCIWYLYHILQVFVPKWLRGRESACQCRRCGFDPTDGKIPWRREWLPTLVFLPGKSHGQRSLVSYSPRSSKESDITEWLSMHV